MIQEQQCFSITVTLILYSKSTLLNEVITMKAVKQFTTIEQVREAEQFINEFFEVKLKRYFNEDIQDNLRVRKWGPEYVIEFGGGTRHACAGLDGEVGESYVSYSPLLSISGTHGITSFLNLLYQVGWEKFGDNPYWGIYNKIESLQKINANLEGISYSHFIAIRDKEYYECDLFE